MDEHGAKRLLDGPVKIINVGLQGFAEDLNQQGIDVVHVDWAPPARGNRKLADLLSRLGASAGEVIDRANTEAVNRMLAANPVLVDVIPASEAFPALKDRMILHAGPPIAWDKMCGPMRGAVCRYRGVRGLGGGFRKMLRAMAADGAF